MVVVAGARFDPLVCGKRGISHFALAGFSLGIDLRPVSQSSGRWCLLVKACRHASPKGRELELTSLDGNAFLSCYPSPLLPSWRQLTLHTFLSSCPLRAVFVRHMDSLLLHNTHFPKASQTDFVVSPCVCWHLDCQ
jgi:hypothetical protein